MREGSLNLAEPTVEYFLETGPGLKSGFEIVAVLMIIVAKVNFKSFLKDSFRK